MFCRSANPLTCKLMEKISTRELTVVFNRDAPCIFLQPLLFSATVSSSFGSLDALNQDRIIWLIVTKHVLDILIREIS